MEVRPAKNTEYFELNESNPTVGITHHPSGLGKLKVSDNGTEYGVPVVDVNTKHLSEWRIEKK